MYIDKIDKRIKKYYKLLCSEYPEWLNDYIEVPALLKQQYISMSCGTYYSDLYGQTFFYTSLDHSIAVALIVWNFTHDKKQTLAGLYHDIATPCFKHCVDFLNGDYMTQESTEDLTTEIIKNSKEIMALLKRDNIKLEEINDYHIYPIADNDIPQLSADRLEYSLSGGVFIYGGYDYSLIEEIYNDIEVQHNGSEIELGFKTKKIARSFVKMTSSLSVLYRDDRTRFSMQLIADILKRLQEDKLIELKDLYEKKEKDIIKIIEDSKYGEIFNIWRKAKKVKVSHEEPKDVYYVKHGAKIRYINPLVNGERISDICKIAKKMIDKNLSYDMDNYVYLDFNF